MTPLLALIINGFREARRNRVTVVVAAFGIVLLLSTPLVQDVTIITFARVLTDVGLGAMSLLSVFLAIFLSSGMLTREIERRTIFIVVSKPISRGTFIVGRIGGNLLTLLLMLIGMYALFALQMVVLREHVTPQHHVAVIGLYFELIVLTCLGFFFGSFTSQFTAAIVVTGLYIIGHLSGDLYRFASRSESELIQIAGKAAYYVLPNLDRLDYRSQASYQVGILLSDLGQSIGYALGYSAVLIVATIAVFQKRDFK
jgi:Cu-processing system permease protein